MDEPLLWGILDLKHLLNWECMRWALAAHNICFSTQLHSSFFAYGKSIPVVRGDGVYQPGMDFCLNQIQKGSWIHLYPEGKVNMTPHKNLRLKWGVGRLISEATVDTIVLPIYHLGMDRVLPNVYPYIPRPFQKVTVVIGEPMNFDETLTAMKHSSQIEKRKTITDQIQIRLRQMKIEAEILHAKGFDESKK